jgi:murein DD-endopeptidase MepM/ murein hydrolase activator NlpD
MKKFLFFFLLIFIAYFIYEIYFLDKFYFLSPIEYKNRIVIRKDNLGDGYFGAKRKGNRRHTGIDLLAEIGTPVRAPRSGRVKDTVFRRGLGNYVEIQHSKNLKTVYGHLQKVFVYKGQKLRQGQIIGLVGKTGNASYRGILPHLHFEVRKKNKPVNPLNRYLD